MSRNIKEIGKELMGKSLNSFHRKTGLTQLEENNKMQDGILDGILSQVDDAYIKKTEQSNVIHLDGSGDGVVVLDSIEGNTMVNTVKSYDSSNFLYVRSQKLDNQYFKLQHSANENSSSVKVKYGNHIYKPNTTYTLVVDIKENTANARLGVSGISSVITKFSSVNFSNLLGQSMITFVTKDDFSTDVRGENPPTLDLYFCSWDKGGDLSNHITFRYWILEGDWTDKEIPPYFEGLQSSFEEKVNDEGKYEIEILSDNGGNLLHGTTYTNGYFVGRDGGNLIVNNEFSYSDYIEINSIHKKMYAKSCNFNICFYDNNKSFLHGSKYGVGTDENYWVEIPKNAKYFRISVAIVAQKLANVSYQDVCNNVKPKQNKIKLLLDEPLRAVGDIKDVLCIKDNKLLIERKLKEKKINGTEGWSATATPNNGTVTYSSIVIPDMKCNNNINNLLCDKFPTVKANQYSYTNEMLYTWQNNNGVYLHITTSKLTSNNVSGFKTYLQNNNFKFVYELKEPVYEEVLNEYGEPIMLEGYENGTLYIDSTIVPTTTVRYTPKMESFKTLNEVNNNNIMLTNDIDDNIIPYMMDVDLMIMEKEMALMSQYKTRTIGAKDMTSMQKRTQDMLTRLIKGKTLTEQECKTRVVTYLNAGKITDAQAEELMLLIDEVYA